MPSIILPSRWRQQPNYPVQLRGSGLGVGVHAAVLPIGGALVDLARRQVISTTFNSPDIIQAAGGRQARIDNANEAWESPFSTTPGAMSLGWLGDFLGAATDSGGVFGVTHSSDSGALPYVANTLKRMASGDMYYQFNNAGSYNALLQSSVGTTGRKSLVGTCTSGAQQVYVNGVAGASASYSGAIQFGSGSRLFVGEDYRLSTRNGNVGMYLGVVWGRALSKQEALAFYRAPYGELFVPRRRVLYFETAGGGTIYNEPLEEVSTLVETYLGNVIYPTSFTETAGLVDSNQASNITNTTLTETESLQDSVAVIQTLGALLNESATLTDSNTVLTTFNPTLTEQTTLQDNNTVVTTFNTTITDSLTGIDNYTGLVIFSATITETLTDPDSYAAEVSVVINESVSGTDSYSVTVNYVTTLNETASVADTINTSWVCNATLTEIQTLVDSITAYISGEEPTSFDIVNLKSFITRILPTNSKITTSITKNSKL